jgi:hypothetical protein
MALQHSPSIITSGLSLCLDAANPRSYPGTGTIWNDVSGNGNYGTLVNGPTYSTDAGGCFIFDGVNDYATMGTLSTANYFTGDFTISVWVMRLTGGPTWGNVIGDYYTGGVVAANQWQIMMSNGAAFTLYRHSTYVINGVSSGYAINQWINVVVTRIGAAITMYANGNSIGTATDANTYGVVAGNLNIGVDGNNAAEPLSGKIGNAMIYRTIGLTADQVAQNFNALRSRYGI